MVELPVPVKNGPHWRVRLHSDQYLQHRLPKLADCQRAVESSQVRLRGWYYPHVSRHEGSWERGHDWIGNHVDFRSHLEYWRMFQSGQFVHLLGVREMLDNSWEEKLRSQFMGECPPPAPTGFINVQNALCLFTEILEFAARLTELGVLDGQVSLDLSLNGVNGVALTTDPERYWSSCYRTRLQIIAKISKWPAAELIAGRKELAIDLLFWFFERFGWDNPPRSVFEQDQEKFLKRQ